MTRFIPVWKSYDDLTKDELHDVLKLRSEVFVVEQNSVYLDIDGWDREAKHLLLFEDKKLCGYFRVLEKGVRYPEFCLSRLVVPLEFRRHSLGKHLMKILLDSDYGQSDIRISAQSWLKKFYEFHGFKVVSKEYMEDGIPHTEMLRKGWSSS